MKELKKNKNTVGIIIIFIAVVFIYKMFAPSLENPDLTATQDVGADLVALSVSLQAVTLDQSVFNSSVYKSLSDFSSPISPQPVGRVNPFDVLGRN